MTAAICKDENVIFFGVSTSYLDVRKNEHLHWSIMWEGLIKIYVRSNDLLVEEKWQIAP